MPEMWIVSCKKVWDTERFATIPMHIMSDPISINTKESKTKQKTLERVRLGQTKFKTVSYTYRSWS